MIWRHLIALLLVALFCFPAWSQTKAPHPEAEQAARLGVAAGLLKEKKAREAIVLLDRVISHYNDAYRNSKERIYASRGRIETLYYLVRQANLEKERAAKVLSSVWADAHYLKAYALIELQGMTEARASLDRALELSPKNAQYLNELGYMQQRAKDWPKALETFTIAEDAAQQFSPEAAKGSELNRARRGLGYVYIELNRLEDAEAKFRQCLEADPKDVGAARQLEAIRAIRSRRAPR